LFILEFTQSMFDQSKLGDWEQVSLHNLFSRIQLSSLYLENSHSLTKAFLNRQNYKGFLNFSYVSFPFLSLNPLGVKLTPSVRFSKAPKRFRSMSGTIIHYVS